MVLPTLTAGNYTIATILCCRDLANLGATDLQLCGVLDIGNLSTFAGSFRTMTYSANFEVALAIMMFEPYHPVCMLYGLLWTFNPRSKSRTNLGLAKDWVEMTEIVSLHDSNSPSGPQECYQFNRTVILGGRGSGRRVTPEYYLDCSIRQKLCRGGKLLL